jgi:hypothetical protein
VPTLYLDRSRIVARQECPTLRYLGYHRGGKGIASPTPKLALILGLCLHVGIEDLFKTGEIEDAVAAAWLLFTNEWPMPSAAEGIFERQEQWYLVEGLLRGFHRVRYPLIMEEFDVVETEVEREVELIPGVKLMVRFDIVLRRKDDGLLVIFDYKTLSYLSEDWQKQHEISLQTLLYTWAARQIWPDEVGGIGIQYEGLLKGLKKKETAKSSPFLDKRIQQSPFCYGWWFAAVGLWQSEWPRNAKGWTKVAVWDHHTPQEWVELLDHQGRLNDLFPVIPVVLPTLRDQELAVSQVVRAEMNFILRLDELEALAVAPHLSPEDQAERRLRWERILFEQNRGRCYKYGLNHGCPFIGYCFNETAALDPIGSGGYVERTPHHAAEIDPEKA